VQAASKTEDPATDILEQNKSGAAAQVGSGLVARKIIGSNPSDAQIKDYQAGKTPPQDSRGGGQTPFAFSAAFNWNDHTTDVTARIGDGAHVDSTAGGVDVSATISDLPRFNARAMIDSRKLDEAKAAGKPGNTKNN